MTYIKKNLIPGLLVLLLLFAAACSRSNDQSTVQEGAQEKATVAPALGGEELDALDLLIVMNSISSARGWNRTLDLSQALQDRFSKYDNKVQFDVRIKGVNEPLLTNGAKTEIPAGAEFGGKLTGALNAEVYVVSGEVGVLEGEVFVSEGTEATVNGKQYKYVGDKWAKTITSSK